jgi:uncharacterized protein YidB (DUF937 family)
MGVQDIMSQLGGQGGQQAAIDQIHKLFGGNGMQGVVTQMTSAGLGQHVQSWIGMGDNMPISGQQLQQAMDPGALRQVAQATGQQPAQVADQVAQVLPHIIDQATPDGHLPAESAMPSSATSSSPSSASSSSPSSASSSSPSSASSSSPSSGSRGTGSTDSAKSTFNR